MLSSSNPRRMKGEARGRSQKVQVLTYDGDENCRPLQVRQRERHNVYWQIVQPYQQLKCMPSISTSLPCISRVTSYQHQERDLGEPGAMLADQFPEGIQVSALHSHYRSLTSGCFVLGCPGVLVCGLQEELSAPEQRESLHSWMRILYWRPD